MGERKGTKALELWCRRITDGYSGVKVDNMTTSWRDGLAFCALIHHFRPDLIDFQSLKKEDVYHNNELAFRTAESYLGIPALLDAEDMAQYAVPDRLSILTYLSQYYQHFASTGSSPSRMSGKRSSASVDRNPLPPSPSSSSPPTKMSTGLGRREPCVACGQPVFLAQRLLVERRLYHRTCFTCARCGAQLSLASCYQTETDGQFCCETCPDEETDSIEDDSATDSIKTGDTNTSKGEDLKSDTTRGSGKNYDRLLSDEEKVRNVQQFKDALEAEDSAFNRSIRGHSIKSSTPSSKALSGFLNTQFQQSDDEEAPALPSTLPPMSPEKARSQNLNQISSSMDLDISSPAEGSLNTVCPVIEKNINFGFESELTPSVSVCEATDSVNLKHSNFKKGSGESVDEKLLGLSPSKDKIVHKSEASSEEKNELQRKFDSLVKKEVASPEKVDSSSREIRLQNVNKDKVHVNQLNTASDLKKENDSNQNNARDYIDVRAEFDDVIAKENQRNVNSDTFDDKKNIDGEMSQGSSSPSLVKMRMKLFETASPETNRLSGITASPIGSRKNALDRDKLVLTKDKLALSENVTSYSSDSTIQGSTVDVVCVEEEIPASSILEITLSHVEVESGVKEESQISEMNVPCIEDIMPFSDTTKSNDIDSVPKDKDNQEVIEVCSTDIPVTVIELKEENIIFSDITDKLEDITEDKNDVIKDENMEISTEDIDIKYEQLNTEVIIPSTIEDIPDITEKETVDVIINKASHEDIVEKETVDVIMNKASHEDIVEKETVDVIINKESHENIIEKETVDVIINKESHEDIIEMNNVDVIIHKASHEDIIEKETVELIEKETVELTENETISEEDKLTKVTKGDVKNEVGERDLIPEVESADVKDIEEDLTNVSAIEIAEIETSFPTDNEEYPDDLNPFGSEDDDEQMPKAPARKTIVPTNRHSMLSHMESTIEVIPSPPAKVSTNPFGSCSEDEEEEPKPPVKKKSGEKPPRPPPPAILISSMRQSLNTTSEPKKLIPATNLNPFDSDDDEVSEDDRQMQTPVPAPRQRIGDGQEPLPVPRTSLGSAGPPSFHGSTSSLTSTISRRKKAPAPKPPAASHFDSPVVSPRTTDLRLEDNDPFMVSTLSTPNSSMLTTSPQLSPRSRKRRPAPAPPTACSTFIESLEFASLPASSALPPHLSSAISSSTVDLDTKSLTSVNSSSRRVISAVEFDEPDPEMVTSGEWDSDKLKDDTNDSKAKSASYENKSTSGVWKRRKGPAPAVPLLQRRAPAQPLSAAAIRRELALLEEQQRGLERQGVRLEEIIRERGEGLAEGAPDPETDELVLQLFELVNEKNELFRRQAELMYIRRQQRLEEEHCDLEHQLRCMMARPEANKTDADKAREEQLLQRLLAVVARRDEVVGALEAERLRERREDQAIREQMIAHRAKLDENSSLSSAESQASMAKKEKKKEKKKWIKRDKDKQKKTDDTNISEEPGATVVKKEKKIKKWF